MCTSRLWLNRSEEKWVRYWIKTSTWCVGAFAQRNTRIKHTYVPEEHVSDSFRGVQNCQIRPWLCQSWSRQKERLTAVSVQASKWDDTEKLSKFGKYSTLKSENTFKFRQFIHFRWRRKLSYFANWLYFIIQQRIVKCVDENKQWSHKASVGRNEKSVENL